MLNTILCPLNFILEKAYAAREPKNRFVHMPATVTITLFRNILKKGMVSNTYL